jgi:hypothetical protein
MQYKTGTQDYLGITIDYEREAELNDFSLNTLKDRYSKRLLSEYPEGQILLEG